MVRKAIKKTKLIESRTFAKYYAWAAVAFLTFSTLFWSILGANIQLRNSDQLVNSYLFEHGGVFAGATLSGAHSFLLKWPIFYLIHLFGATAKVYVGFTVLVVLLTVGFLAALLYKIERRPLVFGTICLALSSVLMLVPAQPYPGGLLPVNMAMLATRNLEYMLYIGSLLIIAHNPRVRSRLFWLATALLGLVVSSDKLFLSVSLGGALMALVIYALVRSWTFVSYAVHWLVASALSAVAAVLLLWLINSSKLTHIINQTGASPYGVVHNATALVTAIIYGFAGLLTNFGANPAFSTTIVRQLPVHFITGFFSVAGPAYLVNLMVLGAGLFAVYELLIPTLTSRPTKKQHIPHTNLSFALIWTSLAAAGVFVISDHAYEVDARYLTIALFAVFVCLATYMASRKWPTKLLLKAGVVLVVATTLGAVGTFGNYRADKNALVINDTRNSNIANILSVHSVDTLVGDYWRVVPVKLQAGGKLAVTPLGDCVQPTPTLNSLSWQPDLRNHSFAFLLSLDKGVSPYPQCSLKQIVDHYGRPNASTLVAGKLGQPKEQLLFYDLGIHNSAPKTPQPASGPSTVVPISLDELPYTSCAVPTSMNIVAHQDDDLLFMNPDIAHDLQAGHCVRTVYVTAGDDGQGSYYWLNREKASEAAYDTIINYKGIWVQRIIKLANNQYIEEANPRGNSKLSLIFMHLPDGNLKGEGFPKSHSQSLESLYANRISNIESVDEQSEYSSNQLTDGLASLMYAYRPTLFRTQANLGSKAYPDHSDHMAVGRFVKRAYAKYEMGQFQDAVTIPIKFYVGYPVHSLPVNVTGADLALKEAAFANYIKYDSAPCAGIKQCLKDPAYGSYLPRQYTNPY